MAEWLIRSFLPVDVLLCYGPRSALEGYLRQMRNIYVKWTKQK